MRIAGIVWTAVVLLGAVCRAEGPAEVAVRHAAGLEKLAYGETAAALAEFDRAVELEPRFAKVYLSRARARMYAGKWDAALADLDKYMALEPRDPDGPQLRAAVLILAGREADADIRRAAELREWKPAQIEFELRPFRHRREDFVVVTVNGREVRFGDVFIAIARDFDERPAGIAPADWEAKAIARFGAALEEEIDGALVLDAFERSMSPDERKRFSDEERQGAGVRVNFVENNGPAGFLGYLDVIGESPEEWIAARARSWALAYFRRQLRSQAFATNDEVRAAYARDKVKTPFDEVEDEIRERLTSAKLAALRAERRAKAVVSRPDQARIAAAVRKRLAEPSAEAVIFDPAAAAKKTDEGWRKFLLGDTKAAIADYDRAIELNGANARAYLLRARARMCAGGLTGGLSALSDLRDYIGREPRDPEGYLLRAQVLVLAGRDADAGADIDRAAELRGVKRAEIERLLRWARHRREDFVVVTVNGRPVKFDGLFRLIEPKIRKPGEVAPAEREAQAEKQFDEELQDEIEDVLLFESVKQSLTPAEKADISSRYAAGLAKAGGSEQRELVVLMSTQGLFPEDRAAAFKRLEVLRIAYRRLLEGITATDDEVRARHQRDRNPKPLAQAAEEIRRQLETEKRLEVLKKLMAELRAKAVITKPDYNRIRAALRRRLAETE